jgi:signal transduction histidine kinase
MTTETLDDVRRRFGIEALTIAPAPPAGLDALALTDPAETPLAYVSWKAPTPGRAVLKAALAPLLALMLLMGSVAVLVARELMRSARRLERALEQASSADRLKTEFLSNVSHELRTPLNGVIGIAQLLKMRELDPEAEEMLDLLLASAHCQLDLVSGLLDITRIETGAMMLHPAPFDPAAAVDETVRLIAPEAARKGIGLRVALGPEARRRFMGDPLAFRQIVANLVGNALKFTDRGEISVRLDAGREGGLTLAVADTGAGIDPAHHERIFERFFQVDGSPTRRATGAGLGLAITRALAELMGGGIRVESALGSGATFVATLPLPACPGSELAAAA